MKMQAIKIYSLLLLSLLASSCIRKGTPFDHLFSKCDTTYISPFSYKCADSTSKYLKKGFCEEYLEDFKTAEGTFKNGKPDGVWKYWFRNDPVRMEGTYREGVKHGKWNYYENDKLFYTLIYSGDTISDSIRTREYVPKEKVYGPAEREERAPVANIENILSFMRTKVCYPERCKDKGIQGTVWTEFVVNHSGEIQDVKIVKSPPNAFDMEAECIRVIRQLPRFRPGIKMNRPVRTRFTVPIQFKIKG